MSNSQNNNTLSKSSLYSPLVAYEQDQVHPSHYLKNKKRAPDSIKESAMVGWLVQVSQDINRNRPLTIGKNNGGRALSQSEVDTRIRQRGLTLVGGGINQEWDHGRKQQQRTAKKNAARSISNRARKRILMNLEAKKTTTAAAAAVPYDSRTHDQMIALHNLWNDYFLKLVGVVIHYPISSSLINMRLASSTMDSMELVGAYVTIFKCKGHQPLVGKKGYVILVTPNMWKIVQIAITKGNHDKFLAVPKRDSILSVHVNMPNENGEVGTKVLSIAIHGK